jgi:hypothetical protein
MWTPFYCRSHSLVLVTVAVIVFILTGELKFARQIPFREGVVQASESRGTITPESPTNEFDGGDDVPYWIRLRPSLDWHEVNEGEEAENFDLVTAPAAADNSPQGAVRMHLTGFA